MKGVLTRQRRQRTVIALLFGALTVGLSSCQPFNQSIEQLGSSEAIQRASELLSGEAFGFEKIYTRNIPTKAIELPTEVNTYFAAVAGGGAPSYNEVALEKNLLYFQRSLGELDFAADSASLFFASGMPGEATVRYLDDDGEEQFKAPDIPNLEGGASLENTYSWFQAVAKAEKPCPSFFYFTGHGAYNRENEDSNWLILWDEVLVSVSEFASWLAPLPADQPFVTMMAQCYSGSFANMIYENGDPEQPVALQTRCGFFATVASRPSVGCTPAVNEADYKDYSSSFFAGLTGRDRIGNPVASADHDQDGKVSYAEAHAFAKVDEETTDWPISTAEAWLQRQVSGADVATIMAIPIDELMAIARPEQRYVIASLSERIGFDLDLPYTDNETQSALPESNTVEEAYYVRLRMELTNVGAEDMIRDLRSPEQMAILTKLVNCEAGSWK